MKKDKIIKKSEEYTNIINTGNVVKSKYFSIFYKKNEGKKYGISIPTKTGKAVVRNKIKRRVKNIIDKNENYIQNNYYYVIITKRTILDISYEEMKNNLINLFSKIGEYNEKK